MAEQRAPDSAAVQDPGDEAAPGQSPGQKTPPEHADVQRQERITELEDLWRRAVADLDNYRKRVARDMERQRDEERSRVAVEWLPVLDNLDRALEAIEAPNADPNAVAEGVRAVRDQALSVLARLGYPRRNDIGQQFDPSRHEAVGSVQDDDAPAGTVVRVVRPGYGSDERLLRPASVLVSARP
jgi:molecular chaperone GrpE